jgi:hypothetical protein
LLRPIARCGIRPTSSINLLFQDAESSTGWSRSGTRKTLVDFHSATLGRSWETDEEYIVGLRGNHSSIVKLPEYDDGRYNKIRGILQKFLAVAPTVVEARFSTLASSGSASQPLRGRNLGAIPAPGDRRKLEIDSRNEKEGESNNYEASQRKSAHNDG